MSGKQPCRKGFGIAGRQQAQYGAAVCPGSQESKPHPGGHQTQYKQPVKRGDYPTAFSVGTASPGILCAVLAPPIQKEVQVVKMHPEMSNKSGDKSGRNVL